MGGEKKVLQKAKNIFKNLKNDPNSVQFWEEKIDNRLVKNQKKKKKNSRHAKDSLLLKLIGIAEQSIDDEEKIPTRVNYVEKREIDRSILYSFDGSFQLIHAHIENLEFLGKSVTAPRYVLLAVDLILQKFMFILCVQESKYYKKWNDFMKI